MLGETLHPVVLLVCFCLLLYCLPADAFLLGGRCPKGKLHAKQHSHVRELHVLQSAG